MIRLSGAGYADIEFQVNFIFLKKTHTAKFNKRKQQLVHVVKMHMPNTALIEMVMIEWHMVILKYDTCRKRSVRSGTNEWREIAFLFSSPVLMSSKWH